MDQVSDRHKIRALYKPPPAEDNSKNYLLLMAVILISVVFIAGEVIGGTIAGSIAIISDAIHLVSDVVGFIFSFVFLYLSKTAMNERVSFGYHRMQLLGALANLFIVWVLVFYIVYQATVRLVNHSFVKHPAIMLITAGAGLMINIVMYMILHQGSGHSHGLLAEECDHEHEHQHAHGHHQHHVSPKYEKKKNDMDCSDICQDLICKQTVIDAHCHRGKNKEVYLHKLSKKHSEENPAYNGRVDRKFECESEPGKPLCEQKHEHLSTCFENKKKQKSSHVHKEGHVHHEDQCHSHSEQSHGSPKHQHHDHPHPHPHSQHDGIDLSHESHDSHQEHKHDDDGHDETKHTQKQNISMKAATLHALSDTVQSVGVLIAAAVIYFFGCTNGAEVTEWNAWHLFDPISTYIFSILSLASTYPIIKNCYYLIMESTPDEIDLDELRGEFENIYGVVDVHDIHVWDLKPGKTIIIAHVLTMAGTERAVLTQLTDMCRHKKIYHSTFQVEEQDFKDDEDYILCHHDIH